MTTEQKFITIYESYINGNISWVKEQVKKLSKANRKEFYQHLCNIGANNDDKNFFFKLI